MLTEMLLTNYCLNPSAKRQLGLTLIEVLIALAILGIAMTAVIKATSQNIRSTSYLQNKTIAMWVGQEVLNEARVGIEKLPNGSDSLKQSRMMLGKEWYFSGSQEETPNQHIKKIKVNVFADENEESTPLIRLESYVYHAE